jgi:hypothetical protein
MVEYLSVIIADHLEREASELEAHFHPDTGKHLSEKERTEAIQKVSFMRTSRLQTQPLGRCKFCSGI